MKYKYMILTSLITYIVIVMVLFIFTTTTKNEFITVKKIDNYPDIKANLNKEIEKVKDEKCKSSLNDMLKRIDDTYFTKNIKKIDYFNSYYKDNETILNYFEDVISSCNLDRKSTDYIYVDALSSTVYPESIKESIIRSYELTFIDKNNRGNSNNEMVGTYTTKSLELKVLKNLIKEVLA